MSFFKDLFFGSSPKNKKVDLLTDQQKDLLNNIIQKALSGRDGFGFDEDFFNKSFADPALRQFEQRTAPSIQQRFINQGLGSSSSLEDSLIRAGADVQGGIDQKRAELLNQALNRQLQAAGLGLGTRAFGIEQDPGEEGLSSALLPLIGSAIGGSLGGPAGASIGSGLGSAGASALNRGFRR